ncbi:Lrp/AsnC family transcriptional regulator [Desertihabitans brevis]|uniref:Lrp/AsnC family transcriptional regulator n=1 Tax=Desertihabitans brevis TaxID=2268447 RepID=A0A367YZB9_9ACTN|nr:Lrp/AsnC family transcriptional regulator [Desertihabitans brevis]RCK71255.1 Lrp/AsnC family transcriptional regulator [Desertihabitans brevis]
MEKIDRQILSLLSGDGRMSYTDIGRATGLSTSAAQQRVRRLEQRGVISGYTARINPEALGRTLTAFVEVTPLDPGQPDDIPERLAPISEVVSCYSIAGDANYLLKVQVGTPLELEHLLLRLRTTGNVTTHTTLVLSIPYEERPLEG